MDNALRMDDHLDALHLDAKKPVRLNHFQALVEQRRGIDGDFWSHVPGWMLERLFWCNRIKIFSRRFAKRPARGRKNNSSDIRNVQRPTPNAQRRIFCIGHWTLSVER